MTLILALFVSLGAQAQISDSMNVRPRPIFGTKTKKEEPQKASPKKEEPKPVVTLKPDDQQQAQKPPDMGDNPPTEQTNPPEVVEVDAPPAPPEKQESLHKVDFSNSVPPEKALGWLKNGNTRFVKHRLRKDGQSKKDIKRLLAKQNPHTIVLSCSDSRIPPELIFDQKLGEIFVIRTMGQILDNSTLGSIEYAVEHLATRLVLVLGHNACGAVAASLMSLKGEPPKSPSLNKLHQDIQPRLQQFATMTPSRLLEKEGWANAKGVAQDLIARSEVIAHHVQSGKVEIKTALYHLESGKVDFE